MSPLPSILNFRDVGQTVNAYLNSNVLQTGKLYRSARPDEASHADRERLVNEYKIKTIVDLRTKTEHVEQARKRDAKIEATLSASEAIPMPDQVAAEPLQIPSITYQNINFNGDAYSKMLIKQLSWWNFTRLIGFMATGRRTEGISVLGKNVMEPRGLLGLGLDSIDVCTAEVKQFFDVIADAQNYPVMVHCTQGKDRTGLTVLLTLLLLHISLEAADHDYMMTQSEVASERKERLKEIHSIGLPDEFADCHPDFVREVDKHIKEKFGSIEEYLTHAGVSQEQQQAVIKNLSATQR